MNRKQFLIQSSLASLAIALPSTIFGKTSSPYLIYCFGGLSPLMWSEMSDSYAFNTHHISYPDRITEHQDGMKVILERIPENPLWIDVEWDTNSITKPGWYYDRCPDWAHFNPEAAIIKIKQRIQMLHTFKMNNPQIPLLVLTDIGRDAALKMEPSHHQSDVAKNIFFSTNIEINNSLPISSPSEIIPSFITATLHG